MKSEIDEIAEKALRLPSTAGASLAELLLESLDYEEDFLVSFEMVVVIGYTRDLRVTGVISG